MKKKCLFAYQIQDNDKKLCFFLSCFFFFFLHFDQGINEGEFRLKVAPIITSKPSLTCVWVRLESKCDRFLCSILKKTNSKMETKAKGRWKRATERVVVVVVAVKIRIEGEFQDIKKVEEENSAMFRVKLKTKKKEKDCFGSPPSPPSGFDDEKLWWTAFPGRGSRKINEFLSVIFVLFFWSQFKLINIFLETIWKVRHSILYVELVENLLAKLFFSSVELVFGKKLFWKVLKSLNDCKLSRKKRLEKLLKLMKVIFKRKLEKLLSFFITLQSVSFKSAKKVVHAMVQELEKSF